MARHDDGGDTRREHHHHKSLKALALAYAPPWLGWLLLGPAAVGLHLGWGTPGATQSVVAVLLALGTAGLIVLTARLARARGRDLSMMALATIGVVGLWLLGSLLAAPWNDPWRSMWLLGGPAVCVAWTIRRALMSGKGEGAEDTQAAKLVEASKGARLSKVATKQTKLGTVVTARAEVDRGEQTVADFQKTATHYDTIMGNAPGTTLISPDGDDAGMADVLLMPAGGLSSVVPFRPSLPGASIGEPITLGVYADGEDFTLTLPGSEKKHRNLGHILMQGLTGAGKSETVRGLMAKVACRTEVTIIVSDPVKGEQSLKTFIDAGVCDLVCTDIPTSKAMLAKTQESIKARGTFLGRKGYKQWEPGCGLTLLVVWLEEADWVTQSLVLERIAKQGRSVGVLLVVSQQRSSYNTTSTDLRANLVGGLCLGVKTAGDAKFNLPDDVVDVVGDLLVRWGANNPGCLIAVHPSIPQERWTKPIKAEYGTDADLAAMLAEHGRRTPMDEVTRQVFGDTYDKIKRVMGGESVATVFAKKGRSDSYDSDSDSDSDNFDPDDDDSYPDDDDIDGEDDSDNDTDAPDDMEPDIDDDAEGVSVDQTRPITTKIEGPPGETFGFGGEPKRPELPTAEARAVVQLHLRAFIAAGKTVVTASDIARVRPETTRGRSWIRQELIRLCQKPAPDEVALDRDDDLPQGSFRMTAPAEEGEPAIASDAA